MKKLSLTILALLFVFAFAHVAFAETSDKDKPSLNNETATEEKAKEETAKKELDENVIGMVTKIEGSAVYVREGAETALSTNTIIRVLDTIDVKEKAHVIVVLFNIPGDVNNTANATELTFGENTRATINKRKIEANGDFTTRIEVHKGKLGSNVKDGRLPAWKMRKLKAKTGQKIENRKSNFQVTTPNAIAGARGTEFIVAVTPEKTFVYVKSGSVWVKERVNGEIRDVKRKRLLEIVMNKGFGIEVKTDDPERTAMENTNFTPAFDPISTDARKEFAEESNKEKTDSNAGVENDVEEKMDKAKGTSENSESPDAVEPGGAVAPEPTVPGPGGAELPEPPDSPK